MFVNEQSALAWVATRKEPQHGAPPILHVIGQPPFHSSTGAGTPVPVPLQLRFRIEIRYQKFGSPLVPCASAQTSTLCHDLHRDGMSAHAIWWEKTEGSQSYPFDVGPKQFKQQFLELQRTCYLLAESWRVAKLPFGYRPQTIQTKISRVAKLPVVG